MNKHHNGVVLPSLLLVESSLRLRSAGPATGVPANGTARRESFQERI